MSSQTDRPFIFLHSWVTAVRAAVFRTLQILIGEMYFATFRPGMYLLLAA